MCQLAIRPENAASEHRLCACIAEQVYALIPNQALYVYWLDQQERSLRLRAMRTPPGRPRVRPQYSGLVLDTSLTPVPLQLRPHPANSPPRPWMEAGERWLDLPVGAAALIRFRLMPHYTLSDRQLSGLGQWALKNQPILAAARNSLICG